MLLRVLFLTLMLTLPAFAGATFSPSMVTGSSTKIEVESWLENYPHMGMVPIKVRVFNADKQSHTWKFTSNTGGYGGGGRITEINVSAGPGQRVEADFYAQVSTNSGSGYTYGSLNLNVTGHEVQFGNFGSLSNPSSSSTNTEYIAMGKKLSAKGWSALKEKFNAKSGHSGSGNDLNGSEVNMDEAPQDWRGYSGLSQLWVEESEWLRLPKATKDAILDWVSFGGVLYVCAQDISETRQQTLQLPQALNGRRDHGAGEVRVLAWDGKVLPLDVMMKEIETAGTQTLRTKLGRYKTEWPLSSSVGKLELRSGLIFGFIVIFGLLVGPVNLFVLAGNGRRHRLFWTTPILSLAGSALLVMLMIFQDGLGGSGSRTVLVQLMPEQRRIAVTQEQVSKTGVLLQRAFPKVEADLMEPLVMDDYQPYENRESKYLDTGSTRSGNWFSSRAIQAQLLQTIRASRAAIEFIPARDATGVPDVISSVEVPLDKVFLMQDNEVWVAEDVGTGERKALHKIELKELEVWMKQHHDTQGPAIKRYLEAPKIGQVYAESSSVTRLALPTHKDIHWNKELLLFVGPYVTQTTAP
jgi:hypothetical protein